MNSDRINPIVIKELRQGLKSRSFIATFLGLQGAMVLSMFMYLAAVTTSNSDPQFSNGFFWFMLGLMLLVFMPLRAFQALHEEIKGNTLEMVFLTRMTAWDIALGKWMALVIQVFLLVAAVLPYLVLRYFLGSIDVAGDLRQLFYQVVLSMMFVAVGVGLSAWTSKVLRGLIIIGAIFSLYTIPLMLFGLSQSPTGSPLAMFGWIDYGVWLSVCGLVMLFFVEYGASQIAPPAENHSLRKRMMAFVLSGILIVYAALHVREAYPVLIGLFMLAPIAVDALCEPLIGIPSLYIKARKFRALRWLLYPGWASGFLFVTVLLALIFVSAFLIEADAEILTAGLVTYNVLLFPFVLIRLIPILARKVLASYVLLQVTCFLFCLLILFLDEIRFISEYTVLGHFLPMLGFFVMTVGDIDELLPVLLMVPTVLMTVLTLLKARRPFLQMQVLSKGSTSGD
ncbi:MAG: hypothetical protein WD708_10575 [Kiritimatiellia bacterium]